MHAFLVTGTNQTEIENQISKLCKKHFRMDFELQKIGDLRDLSKFTSIKISQKTAIIIKNIDKASIEAQNAFLKSLEEPQSDLIYVLTAQSAEAVLPTVLSRCQIVNLQFTIFNFQKEIDHTKEFLGLTVGERLATTSKIKSREEALIFVKSLIQGGHELLLQNPKLAQFLESAQKTYNALNANGNIQLQLTNFVASI